MCGEKVNKATETIALRVQMAYLTIELIDKIQEGSHYNITLTHHCLKVLSLLIC